MADYCDSNREYKIREAFDAEYELDQPCINSSDCIHHRYEIKAVKIYYKNMMLYRLQKDFEKQIDLVKRVCYFAKSSPEFFKSHSDARIGIVESLTELIANQNANSIRALLQGTLAFIKSL